MANLPNLYDIVPDWLKRHGFEGLYNEFMGCGCGVDDIMPCHCPDPVFCEAGYEICCGKCDEIGTCVYYKGVLEWADCTPDDRPDHVYYSSKYPCGHDENPNDLTSGFELR